MKDPVSNIDPEVDRCICPFCSRGAVAVIPSSPVFTIVWNCACGGIWTHAYAIEQGYVMTTANQLKAGLPQPATNKVAIPQPVSAAFTPPPTDFVATIEQDGRNEDQA